MSIATSWLEQPSTFVNRSLWDWEMRVLISISHSWSSASSHMNSELKQPLS